MHLICIYLNFFSGSRRSWTSILYLFADRRA